MARDLFSDDDIKRMAAFGSLCITLVALLFTYGCVKEVFAPPRAKSK